MFPALAAAALFLFYLEGRNRWRPLLHLLLLAWHLSLTDVVLYGTLYAGKGAYFEGAMWGVRVPLAVLAIPFAALSALAIAWVWREARRTERWEPIAWEKIQWKKVAVAALLLLPAVVLFHFGEGFDSMSKAATALTVVQWILLARGVSPN